MSGGVRDVVVMTSRAVDSGTFTVGCDDVDGWVSSSLFVMDLVVGTLAANVGVNVWW